MEQNGGGNGRGRPTGPETDRERQKGSRMGSRRTTGSRSEKATVGGERDGVPGFLQGRKCRLDSALTISGTGATKDLIRHSGEWPRPTRTWASSRKQGSQKESTPTSRRDIASSLRTRRANTTAEWPYSTGRHHFLWWERTPIWSERCQFPVVDGSAAVVHHWMLPRPVRHLVDRECCCRAQGAAPRHRTDSGGGP